MTVYHLLDSATATGAGAGISPKSFSKTVVERAFHAKGTTSSGTGAATVVVEVSNTDVNADYITLGTITLTLGVTSTSDGFTSSAPWEFVRGNVTAISGTGATVTLNMGV
jgi:hypothetical protein